MMERLRDPSLLLVAIATALLCTIENWALGPLSWIYGYGSGLETIPTLLALSYDGRNTATWAPFVAGGVDRIAFWGNASPLSIEYLLFAHLPVWLANGLDRFLQYFVGIYFTERVLTDVFSQRRSWAAFGGITFACFSYFTVGQLFTLPGVPLLIWSLERLCRRDSRAVFFVLVAVAFSFTTTFTFGIPYYLAFATLWLVTRCVVRGVAGWVKVGLFFAGLVVPTTFQLWAVALNAPSSQRASWAIESLPLSLHGLFYTQLQYDLFNQDKLLSDITQVLPTCGFVVAFLLLLYTRWRYGKLGATEHDFLRVAFLFFLFSQRWMWLALQHVAATVLPWAGGIYMGRFFEIPASFLIAIGLTFAAQIIWFHLNNIGRRVFATSAIALALVFLIHPKLFLAVNLGIGDWGEANYKVAALDDLQKATPSSDPFRVASVLPLQPAYAYAQGLEAADGWANIYSADYRNLWLKVLAPLFVVQPNAARFFGVESGRSVDAFVFLGLGLDDIPGEDISAALREGFDVDRRFRVDLLRLLNVRYLLSEYPLRGAELQLVHQPMVWPARYISRDPNTGLTNSAFPPLPDLPQQKRSLGSFLRAFEKGVERRREGKDVFIYKIADLLPRIWLAQAVRVVDTPSAALEAVAALPQAEIGRLAIAISEELSAKHEEISADGKVAITDYGADHITASVETPSDALLVIANSWSPFWFVTVDGEPAQALKVNYLQIGVALTGGTHVVELRYRPPHAAVLSAYRIAF